MTPMRKMNKAHREGRQLFEVEMNHANLRELCERFVLLQGNSDPEIWTHTISLASREIAIAKQLKIEGSYER